MPKKKIDAVTFLRALSAGKPEDLYLLTGRLTKNGMPVKAWDGKPLAAGPTYFCVGLSVDPTRRRLEDIAGTIAFVIDDVGTKVDPAKIKLEPSWKIETSAGNFQWGYMLSFTDDIAGFDALNDAMADAGLQDAGAKGINRVVRLPGSINIKEGRDNFVSVVHDWHLERGFTLQGIADAHGLKLDRTPQKKHTVNAAALGMPDPLFDWLCNKGYVCGAASGGWWEVTCPFVEEHDKDPRTTMTYKPLGADDKVSRGVKCWHAHGGDASTFARRFFEWAVAQGGPKVDAAAEVAAVAIKKVAAALKSAGAAEVAGEDELAAMSSREWTLDELRAELVMMQDGPQVTFLSRPYIALPFSGLKVLLAGSYDTVPTASGKSTKRVYRIDQWNDSKRLEVWGRTHAPGRGPMCEDPAGRKCVNLWRDRPHVAPEDWKQRVKPFVEHLEYLTPIAAERERFIDWLAHAEQQPQVRPHTHYLMRTRKTQGVGRNWVSSVLARVWIGSVAQSVDLMGMLAGGFNGLIGGSLLGVVDELHIEQAGTSLRKLTQSLKSELSAEVRAVKPKYGREYSEFCTTRWLMFSNHVAALPVPKEDRRIVVIENPDKVRPATYYSALYGLLNDTLFIAAVREYLRQRDVSRFNPGEHAPMTAAKAETVEAATGVFDTAAQEIVQAWPSDLLLSGDLRELLAAEDDGNPPSSNALRAIALEAGMRPGSKQIKFGGKPQRYWILRNHDRWAVQSNLKLLRELQRGRDGVADDVTLALGRVRLNLVEMKKK